VHAREVARGDVVDRRVAASERFERDLLAPTIASSANVRGENATSCPRIDSAVSSVASSAASFAALFAARPQRGRARSRRALVAGVAVALVALIAVTGFGTYSTIRERVLEERARIGETAQAAALLHAASVEVFVPRTAGRARTFLDKVEPRHRKWEWHHLYVAADLSLAGFFDDRRYHTSLLTFVAQAPGAPATRAKLIGAHASGPVEVQEIEIRVGPDRRYEGAERLDEVRTIDIELDGVEQLAASPDAEVIAVAGFVESKEKGAREYRVLVVGAAGAQPANDIRLHAAWGSCNSVALSTDARHLAMGCGDGAARLYSLPDAKLLATFAGPTGSIRTVAFHPDGKRLVTASEDNTVRVWDLQGTAMAELKGPKDHVMSLAFHPQRDELAVGSIDGSVWFWDLAGCPPTPLGAVHVSKAAVRSVAYRNPDGRLLAAGLGDGSVVIYEAADPADPVKVLRPLSTLAAHGGPVYQVAYSPDGAFLLTRDRRGVVKVWPPARAEAVPRLVEHGSSVARVAFRSRRPHAGTPVGEVPLLASCATVTKGELWLWDVTLGKRIGTLRDTNDVGVFASIAWSADGETLAAACEDGVVHLWSVDGFGAWDVVGDLGADRGGSKTSAFCVAFSPDADGSLLAAGHADGTVDLWKRNGNSWRAAAVVRSLDAGPGEARALCFLPGERFLASGSRTFEHKPGPSALRVWDVPRGELTWSAEDFGGICDLAALETKTGALLAAACIDHVARVWRADSGGRLELVHTLKGHAGPVWSVAFHPEGERLASGSEDFSIKLWDLDSGLEMVTLHGHLASVRSLDFTPDGKTLASGSGGFEGTDNVVRLWETEVSP